MNSSELSYFLMFWKVYTTNQFNDTNLQSKCCKNDVVFSIICTKISIQSSEFNIGLLGWGFWQIFWTKMLWILSKQKFLIRCWLNWPESSCMGLFPGEGKIFQWVQKLTICLKNAQKHTIFFQKSRKTYYFGQLRGAGGGKYPSCTPLRTPMESCNSLRRLAT